MSSKPATNEDEELLRALPQIDSALRSGASAAPGAPLGAAAVAVDPCAVYKKLAPFLPTLIKAAKRIPIFGSQLAQALTILQQIGAKCCK